MSSNSSSSSASTRSQAVEAMMVVTRAALKNGANHENLDIARAALANLAADHSLWGDVDYPAPEPDEQQARYIVAQDDAHGLTLYLNVMRPGKKIPPHDHTTWACIASVEGVEQNALWDRVDDRSVPGKAELRKRYVVELGSPETRSVALMPDDIHSVEIKGDDIIRHLHMYGRPLETLSERTVYDPEKGTCKAMSIGVQTRR